MQFARPTKVPLKRPGQELDAFATGWRRRLRLSLEAPRLRLHPPDLSLLPDRLHLIRVDGRLVAWPTPRWEWVRVGQGGPQRLAPVSRLEPLQIPAFELSPRFQRPTPPNIHFTHLDLSQASGGRTVVGSADSAGTGSGSGASAGASGAVGAGAAVLALAVLVLLARALERCLDQRLFKLLRRRSDEWFTPNVLATSTHLSEESTEDAGAGEDCLGVPLGDPPPPYSMCLPKNPSIPRAEPPPPYSVCYVAFGPHDQPRVHLNTPNLNTFQDTGQIGTNEGSQITHDRAPVVSGAPESSRGGEGAERARSHSANVTSEESDAPPYSQVA